MNNNSNIAKDNLIDDEIDIRELFHVLWNGKWLMLSIISIFLILALIYSATIPNIYQSKALLTPVGEENTVSGSMRNYGGLASLAGISLPSQNNMSNSIKAMEKLHSLSFFQESILPNIFLPDLMATEKWDSVANKIIYDSNIYDSVNQKWVRGVKFPKNQVPSSQESFEIFQKDHLQVSENKDTGFVTISIKHQSPYIAQAWIQIIVSELNSYYRSKDKAEAQVAADFLNNQLAQTSFAEIKEVIAELLQQKMKQLTLIEVNEHYVYDYLDPPVVMENKHAPSRVLIALLGALIGALTGFIILIVRYFYSHK